MFQQIIPTETYLASKRLLDQTLDLAKPELTLRRSFWVRGWLCFSLKHPHFIREEGGNSKAHGGQGLPTENR